MYFQLTGAVSDRVVAELRQFWMYHPRYRSRLPDNIQSRFAFKERPQVGMVVKSGGASNFTLSADNYVGMVNSYVYLAKFQNYPGGAIEWVREDSVAIQNNAGHFPSPPGIYYIQLNEENQFQVQPLYNVYREQVVQVDPTNAQLQRSFHPGSLRLFEGPSGFLLQEGINYTADPQTGAIVLALPLTNGRWLEADYRTLGELSDPFLIQPNRADNSAIPGAVLAFGNRNEKGDKMAVVVQEIRHPAHLQYGGQWDVSVDIEIFARDVHEQREMADRSVIYLWAIVRDRLTEEGLKIEEISLGGEAEEVYDENADDYFFTCSISLTVKTDWEVQVPLNSFIRQASPTTLADIRRIAGLTDDQLDGEVGNIKILEGLGLDPFSDPFFKDRTRDYHIIR